MGDQISPERLGRSETPKIPTPSGSPSPSGPRRDSRIPKPSSSGSPSRREYRRLSTPVRSPSLSQGRSQHRPVGPLCSPPDWGLSPLAHVANGGSSMPQELGSNVSLTQREEQEDGRSIQDDGDTMGGADDSDIVTAGAVRVVHTDETASIQDRGSKTLAQVSTGMIAVSRLIKKDRLCPKCARLDLRVENFIISEDRSDRARLVEPHPSPGPSFHGRRSLGTASEIRQRSSGLTPCPLCRLLIDALEDQPRYESLRSFDSNNYCDIYWIIDGRERYTQQDGSIKIIKRTRRLCVEWRYHSLDKIYIVLVGSRDINANPEFASHQTTWRPPEKFLGRLLTSIVPNENNVLLEDWYETCMKNHGSECQSQQSDDFKTRVQNKGWFSVIDTKDMRLTRLPKGEKYAALSYTWGPGPTNGANKATEVFQCTERNAMDLQKEKGIEKVFEELPLVVQEAIRLVQRLNRRFGIRYLWVDSICIVQKYSQSWQLNSNVMDVIYGNAELTIAGADGEHANVGFEALKQESRHERDWKQQVATYRSEKLPHQSFSVMVTHPSETYIRRSRWDKRAWTFQERVLSKKLLIFTSGRMYYQCPSGHMSEDIWAEDAHNGWIVELPGAPAQVFKNPKQDPVGCYKKSLEMYTTRKLTNEMDILSAFKGLAKVVCDYLGGEPVFAMPNSHFDWALLWNFNDHSQIPQRRKDDSGKCHFPSWAWCAWKDQTMVYHPATVDGVETNLNEWLTKHTWIVWYIKDEQGSLRLVWDPKVHQATNYTIAQNWVGYNERNAAVYDRRLARMATWYPGDDDDRQRSSRDNSLEPLRERYLEFMKSTDYYGRPFRDSLPEAARKRVLEFEKSMFPFHYQTTIEVLDVGTAKQAANDQTTLQFWTWSAKFRLKKENALDRFSNKDHGLPSGFTSRYAILDEHNDFVGTIMLHANWSDEVNADGLQEFVAISDARDFNDEEYASWNFYIEGDRGASQWHLYNVMLVGWTEDQSGSLVARRLGLGKIYQAAFRTACKNMDGTDSMEWKEIILG